MNSRLALPIGLLLLTLCSSGLAIKCYNCEKTMGECTTTQTCDAGVDGCMRITQTGSNIYACRTYSTCTSERVKADYNLGPNFDLKCCQSDLCNKGFTGLPASGLILFLAAALLLFFS